MRDRDGWDVNPNDIGDDLHVDGITNAEPLVFAFGGDLVVGTSDPVAWKNFTITDNHGNVINSGEIKDGAVLIHDAPDAAHNGVYVRLHAGDPGAPDVEPEPKLWEPRPVVRK